jgi:tRNA(Ile2) C34 agmatinyltransferase TiaS
MIGKNGIRESMVKELSIERRETERPLCPDCGASNPNSQGSVWRCRICGRQYSKVYKNNGLGQWKEMGVRPICPKCGGSSMSHGIKWACRVCGKTWMKRNHPKNKDFGERPLCPMCKTPNPTSAGESWECGVCKHQWRKIKKRPLILSPMELATAKIINV